MQGGKEYMIQFAGLSLGEHKYEFEVNDTFFENLENCEIIHGTIPVVITLLKQSTMMILQFDIGGTVKVNCDICAGEFDLPIKSEYRLVVKVGGHESGNEDDDIITVSANEHQLDLSQYIYEYIILSLPIKRIHPDKKGKNACDKEVLKKLKDHIIENEEEHSSDPRWDSLKNIKLN